jgi:hypothetical protein
MVRSDSEESSSASRDCPEVEASQQPDCTPGHLWTSVDKRGHVWTCVDICEHLWTLHSADRSDLADIGGHLWTSGHAWTCVDMCGHVWTLDPGPRCAYCAAVRPEVESEADDEDFEISQKDSCVSWAVMNTLTVVELKAVCSEFLPAAVV